MANTTTTSQSYNLGHARNASGNFTNPQGGCQNAPPSLHGYFVFNTPTPGNLTIDQQGGPLHDRGPIQPNGTFHVTGSPQHGVNDAMDGQIANNGATGVYRVFLGGCVEMYQAAFAFSN
jgi:hypothetical protein